MQAPVHQQLLPACLVDKTVFEKAGTMIPTRLSKRCELHPSKTCASVQWIPYVITDQQQAKGAIVKFVLCFTNPSYFGLHEELVKVFTTPAMIS